MVKKQHEKWADFYNEAHYSSAHVSPNQYEWGTFYKLAFTQRLTLLANRQYLKSKPLQHYVRGIT